ncbi:NAD(P)/FAD-dependent oxidoreductase [Desulfonatronum thioautotrophicum]|uniref:NAD(P)/FAD-dependent oxidoreductase n=1 Tax=Desulfonatronum thioautotrophicum TaxID=617001 RepID=UPI0005EB2BE4|nr:FAD-dependent oxidoreductase [Desulfonatronum thioautotrophicum]
MQSFDTVIIGGGPAGMTAALYLLRSGASVALVERLAPGGQILTTEWIENYPGHPKGIKGYELADLMADHLKEYPLVTLRNEVRSIEHHGPGRNIVHLDEFPVQAKAVVICSGVAWKRLGLEREEYFVGRGVSYCALCDANFFKGQAVAAVGGGNTALEESLYLAKIVKKVYLIHRRDAFRADKIFQKRVQDTPNIECVMHSVPTELLGETELQGVRVTHLPDGSQRILDIAGLFVFVGSEALTNFVPPALSLSPSRFIPTDQSMATNLPGIYAAGDVRDKHCRQVATAVGDGANAAQSASLFLDSL